VWIIQNTSIWHQNKTGFTSGIKILLILHLISSFLRIPLILTIWLLIFWVCAPILSNMQSTICQWQSPIKIGFVFSRPTHLATDIEKYFCSTHFRMIRKSWWGWALLDSQSTLVIFNPLQTRRVLHFSLFLSISHKDTTLIAAIWAT